MQFKLINRRTKEVVDTIEVIKSEEQMATEHFQLKNPQFVFSHNLNIWKTVRIL